ncbi:MAG: response regulator [Deltaproteobacteria bacterium]|nr:response regulator [Deltaproteobacteria bacterium]
MNQEPSAPTRVLVVDDSVQALSVLLGLLRGAGFVVSVAADGAAALTAAQGDRPDVVLLDLELPHLEPKAKFPEGFAVLAALKSDARTAGASVIVVSGSSAESDIVRALDLGAIDYVTKPYAPAILLARIGAALRSRREMDAIWRLGEDLRVAQEELGRVRRSAAIGDIAAGLAHEINNPAAYVVTDLHEMRELADELLDAGDEHHGEALAALAEEALAGMNRIRDAVRDLSVFSAVVDRRSIPSAAAIDLAAIARRRAERFGAGLSLRGADEPALVAPALGGEDELDALLGLLVRHAASGAEQLPDVRIDLERSEHEVTVRIDASASAGEPPAEFALALAIARELAERFGGTVEQTACGCVLRLPAATARG